MVAFQRILTEHAGWNENAKKGKFIMEAGVGETLSLLRACIELTSPRLVLAVDKRRTFRKERRTLYEFFIRRGMKDKLGPVNFLVNDLLYPCFRPGSFDLIYCNRLFSNMKGIASERKDIIPLAGSLVSLLRPNAKMLVLEYYPKPRTEGQVTHLEYWKLKNRMWEKAGTGSWPLIGFRELESLLRPYDATFGAIDFGMRVPLEEMGEYVSYLRKISEFFQGKVSQEFKQDISRLAARMQKYGMEVLPCVIATVSRE